VVNLIVDWNKAKQAHDVAEEVTEEHVD